MIKEMGKMETKVETKDVIVTAKTSEELRRKIEEETRGGWTLCVIQRCGFEDPDKFAITVQRSEKS